ncbi:MAG: hypothetical protein U1F24_04220 [Alphaproteobacteria bacterium]
MAMKLSTVPHAARHAARIKALAVARFGEGEEVWLVTEEACGRTDGSGRSTVVALLHPAAQIAFRILRPMAEIGPADIDALGEAAALLAAEACC